MEFYSGCQNEVPFTDQEIKILEERFLNPKNLVTIKPMPQRVRLASQLLQMIKNASLQPNGQMKTLLKYPVFRAYANFLLGQ